MYKQIFFYGVIISLVILCVIGFFQKGHKKLNWNDFYTYAFIAVLWPYYLWTIIWDVSRNVRWRLIDKLFYTDV